MYSEEDGRRRRQMGRSFAGGCGLFAGVSMARSELAILVFSNSSSSKVVVGMLDVHFEFPVHGSGNARASNSSNRCRQLVSDFNPIRRRLS